jgi:hypothetical protein
MLRLTKDLTPLRTAAEQEIDATAEAVRGLFITSGSGQSMVYTQKEKEAELVTADPDVSPAIVPHIVLEAQLNGLTLLDQAAIVLTMAHQWRELSSHIEVARLAGKSPGEGGSDAGCHSAKPRCGKGSSDRSCHGIRSCL